MFQPGDLVLRKVFENTADPSVEKFQPNWEGPYIVTKDKNISFYGYISTWILRIYQIYISVFINYSKFKYIFNLYIKISLKVY